MRIRAPFLMMLSLGALAVLQACGGDDTIIDLTPDAAPDTSLADTSPPIDSGDPDTTPPPQDSGVVDSGPTDGGIQDSGGGGVLLRCGDAAVSSCSQCNGAPQPCVYCGTNDASALSGRCTALHQNCLNTIPQGFEDCRCTGDASACPESYQVCTAGITRCHTCSDNNTNNGLTCENGGKCTYADGGCN